LDSDIIEEKVNNNSSGQFVIMNDMDKDKMNEFAHLIRHEDFSKVLQLADKLKREEEAIGQRQHDLSHLRKTRKLSNDRKEHPSRREEKDPNSYGNVAELIRTTLLPSAIGADVFDTVGLMGRGESQITDSLIDDTIHSLANELKLCLDLKGQRRARRESQTFETVRLQDGLHGDDKTNPSANNAIKFLKWQTDILTNWMIAHSVGFVKRHVCRKMSCLSASPTYPNTLFVLTQENPFPTHAQIYELAKATNLTETQVVNWTTNVRKRNLKGTVELGKKPHHFLDYLFLATDREKQMRHAHPEMNDFLYKGSGLTPRALIHNHKGGHEVLDGTHDPPGRSTIAYPTSRAQTGFTLADHEISRPHLHLEQPDIHRRNLAIPKAQKKTKRIFRRGKGLGAQNEDELAHSMGKIPRQNSERFPMDDVDHYAFNEYEEMYHPKIVSFESMCDEPLPYDNEVPFDENMASYLGMLFADE
jgi:hypothetical protein